MHQEQRPAAAVDFERINSGSNVGSIWKGLQREDQNDAMREVKEPFRFRMPRWLITTPFQSSSYFPMFIWKELGARTLEWNMLDYTSHFPLSINPMRLKPQLFPQKSSLSFLYRFSFPITVSKNNDSYHSPLCTSVREDRHSCVWLGSSYLWSICLICKIKSYWFKSYMHLLSRSWSRLWNAMEYQPGSDHPPPMSE